MNFSCSKCGQEYDTESFAGLKELQCQCGKTIDLEEIRAFAQVVGGVEDKERALEIQKLADEVSLRILNEEYSRVDVEIAKARLRDKCLECFPEKMYLYDMLYESRFQRLWEQFREKGESEGS